MELIKILEKATPLDQQIEQARDKIYRLSEEQKALEFELKKALVLAIEEHEYKTVFRLFYDRKDKKYVFETLGKTYCAKRILSVIQEKGKISYSDILNNNL
jgi:hypothetical protein